MHIEVVRGAPIEATDRIAEEVKISEQEKQDEVISFSAKR